MLRSRANLVRVRFRVSTVVPNMSPGRSWSHFHLTESVGAPSANACSLRRGSLVRQPRRIHLHAPVVPKKNLERRKAACCVTLAWLEERTPDVVGEPGNELALAVCVWRSLLFAVSRVTFVLRLLLDDAATADWPPEMTSPITMRMLFPYRSKPINTGNRNTRKTPTPLNSNSPLIRGVQIKFKFERKGAKTRHRDMKTLRGGPGSTSL